MVWKQPAIGPRAGMMHCTSTTIASHSACSHDQLLAQEVACYRDALAHQGLVGGAAYPRQIDSLCSLLPGQRDQLRIGCCGDDHLREKGLVAVDDDIHLLRLYDPMLASESRGLGVPKMTSCSSVAIMEPPQPSEMLVLRPCSMRFT